MQQLPTTVHADAKSVEDLIDRLVTLTNDMPTYPIKPDMSLEVVLERIKRNVQYHESPSTSHVYVNIQDLKILLQAVETKQTNE